MDDRARRRRAAWLAGGVFVLFFVVGILFVLEIRSAQVGLWRSELVDADRYLWFARLQTAKTLTAFVALLLALLGAAYGWRYGQRPE